MAKVLPKRKSAGDFNRPRRNRMLKSLQLAFAGIEKLEVLADAQVGNDVRHQDLAWFGLCAQSSGQLDGRAAQVLMLFAPLARADADADNHRMLSAIAIMRGELALNRTGAAHRAGGRMEGGHNPIARVLDLPPVVPANFCPDDMIVDGKHGDRDFVAMYRGHFRGSDDIREHDRAHAGVM